MIVKGIAFLIFFGVFIFLTSFYPEWGHYPDFPQGTTSGTNFILDIVALLFSVAIGALSFVSISKLKQYFKQLIIFLQEINKKNRG